MSLEVEELARVLNKMGAKIQGARHADHQAIEGVDELLTDAARDHSWDRIEAGTFAVRRRDHARRSCCLEGARAEHMDAIISEVLRSAGATISWSRPAACASKRSPGETSSRSMHRQRNCTRAFRPTCRRSSW